MPDDPRRSLLRHTLATLAYRGGKAVRDVPAGFASFKAGPSTRSPVEILAHIGDLMDWALSIARGKQEWHNAPPRPWDEEVARFFAAVKAFDDHLAGDGPLGGSPESLFQGPVADALAHVGQITLLRRLAGGPVRGENYHKADIELGRVGAKQAPPRLEFD
jgi:hypothetical protein